MRSFEGCVSFPSSLGKSTRTRKLKVQSDCIQTEEDSDTWCYCKEDKDEEMIVCDSKFVAQSDST